MALTNRQIQTRTAGCLALLALVACGSSTSSGLVNGGAANDEGNASSAGKTNVAGTSVGGTSIGGTASGGTATGGSATGGAASGGSASGGSASGGSASGGSAGGSGVYTTDFDLTESPLSEGGHWKNDGLDWTRIVTAGGLAYGSQTGSGGFDDSYAYLLGTFPANQSATATIHLETGITAAYEEVEILLRWTDSAHNAMGYECNLAYNGQYAEIIKWPGPFATVKTQFTFISSGNPVSGGVHDGDVFQADVIGNVITSRLNGKVIATGTDGSIPSGGAPGIGFYAEGAAASKKFSFTHFSGGGL